MATESSASGEKLAASEQDVALSVPAPSMSVWARIKEHKVAQWTLAYAAAAYTLLHGTEMVSNAFDWPHLLVRILTLLLFLGAPLVVTLAWYHGHRAQRRAGGVELTIITVLLVIAGTALWHFARPHEGQAEPKAGTTTPAASADLPPAIELPDGPSLAVAPKTIAILPFADLSPTHDMEYFTDGIAEELMNSLSRVSSLRVIGRRSAFAFKGTNDDARTIGELLKVDSILEGSVRKAGERIRISARLVRTQDGFSLWSENYDRKLNDVLDIQSSIAGEVAAALSPVINPAAGSHGSPAGAPVTKSPEAYNAYLRGIYQGQRLTDSNFLRARDEFRHALEIDPQFALAHARLAEAYVRLARSSLGNVAETRMLAASSLKRAVELDPSIADLWWVRVWLGDDASTSLVTLANTLEGALTASPDNATVILLLAEYSLYLGRRAEALDLYERARSVDPLWTPAIYALANANYLYRGDRQRTLALLDEMESLASDDPGPANLRALMAFSEGRALDWDHWKAKAIELAPRDQPLHGYLSLDYGYLGMLDAAMYHARMCHVLNPQSAASAYTIAHVQLYSGKVDAARPVVRRAVAEHPKDFLAQLAQAQLQYFTGDCGGAIQSLELARPGYKQPAGSYPLMFNRDQAVVFVWCLRKQGDSTRAQDFARAFDLQMAPPITAGVMDGIQARMAAASGDRPALVQHLEALVRTNSMGFAFARHEPMIQPYLQDPRVKALLDTLDARRAEWRKLLPKSSMRVPIPGINDP